MQANASYLFLFFIFLAQSLSAQNNPIDSSYPMEPAGVVHGKISLPGLGFIYDWETNSSIFTNNFLFDIRRDLQITKESKENSAKKLGYNNYFVNHQEGGIYYLLPLKSIPGLGLLFSASAVSHQDARFNRGAFELILNGNAHYKNQKKDLGKTYYRSIDYQQIGIGIRKYFANKTACLEATASFLIGDYANQFEISRGSVFTEANGEYIDIDLAYDRRFSSSGATLLTPKGYGGALNLSWTKYFTKKNASLLVSLKNLGAVHYSSATAHQSIDTTIHFTGVDAGEVASFSAFNNLNARDTILSKFNIKSRDEAFNFSLPTLFEIKYEDIINKRSLVQLQINAYLYNALPLIKVGYLYQLKNNLYLGGAVRAHGYSQSDIDITGRYRKGKIFAELTVRSIDGLLNPRHSSGLGAFAHLGFYLK